MRCLAGNDVNVVARRWSGGSMGGVDGDPLVVGVTRDIRRPRKKIRGGISTVKGSLCGVEPKHNKVVLLIVRKAVVENFCIISVCCRHSPNDAAEATVDGEAACPTLAHARGNSTVCALISGAVRHRKEAEAHKNRNTLAELEAASAATYIHTAMTECVHDVGNAGSAVG